jgi:hypothetical protein
MTPRRLAAFAILAALPLSLAACDPPVTHGTVVEHDYTPAHTEIQPQCFAYDPKSGMCTSQVFLPQDYAAIWQFELRDSKGHTGWVDVDQKTYNSIKDGETY